MGLFDDIIKQKEKKEEFKRVLAEKFKEIPDKYKEDFEELGFRISADLEKNVIDFIRNNNMEGFRYRLELSANKYLIIERLDENLEKEDSKLANLESLYDLTEEQIEERIEEVLKNIGFHYVNKRFR